MNPPEAWTARPERVEVARDTRQGTTLPKGTTMPENTAPSLNAAALAQAIDDAVSAFINAAHPDLPPGHWIKTETGIFGGPNRDSGDDAEAWAQRLGLTADPTALAGTVRYVGEIGGIGHMTVHCVVDTDAYLAALAEIADRNKPIGGGR